MTTPTTPEAPRRDPAPYELLREPDGSSTTARENITDILRRELLGPASGDEEVLEMSPGDRYILGRIAPVKLAGTARLPSSVWSEDVDDDAETAGSPRGVPVPGVDETIVDADEDGTDDNPVQRGLMIPASMGLRFQLPLDVSTVTVRASWGTYEPESGEESTTSGRARTRYRRTPIDIPVQVDVANLIPGETATVPLKDAVCLRVDIHIDPQESAPGRARRIVEIALCNDRVTPSPIPVGAWLYQSALHVEADDKAVFLPVYDPVMDTPRPTDDDELRRLDLQYRDRLEFAIGRTCSVDWVVDRGSRKARQVSTTWLPSSETPQTRAGEVPGTVTDMRALAEAADDPTGAALESALRPIIDGYGGWLETQTLTAQDLPKHLGKTANEAIAEAASVNRMLAEGLDFLVADADARRCFAFMNAVMADQRIRSQVAEVRAADQKLGADEALAIVESRGPGAHSWRMFQLAFILLQVPGLCRPDHPRRSSDTLSRVELLFFPTGGGKTEAYLGLAAFAFAIRRLQGVVDTPDGPLDGTSGVTVLMRYTLRLLTAQQFQRATALVCAAEEHRRADEATWGSEPFRIGLWVGSAVSPKRVKEASDQLQAFHEGRGRQLTALQIKRCPWCGTSITEKDVQVDTTVSRMYVYCGDDLGECPFSLGGVAGEGLPVLTVDEEIYRLAPAFVIATVDKFARLAREGEAASLFGYVSAYCERHGFVHRDYPGCSIKDGNKHPRSGSHPAATVRPAGRLRPPDLIIQDELHLITGALGTTVGLFESAIDVLTSWKTSDGTVCAPMIVASTATVRNAQQQCRALYGRAPLLFPPRILDADDTFFSTAVEVGPENPGRRYVGVSTTGVRLTKAEIRVAEVLMAAGQHVLDTGGAAADPYLTLVGYFNATRELAGMVRYMQDDVQTALGRGRRGVGLPRRFGTVGQLNVTELTSRVSGTGITDALDQMAIGFDPDYDTTAARLERSRRIANGLDVPKRPTPRPFDAVLATSMLQVGVDVTRLGLMLIVGQPKNTAEYIQASSRVGRDPSRPGLVVSLGNWARPRDLAHYEQFRHYHETFYSQVEPLSVTPYSVTALERGLDGVLVSAVRVVDAAIRDGLSPEAGAWRIEDRRKVVEGLIDALIARAKLAADDDTATYTRGRLLRLLDVWEKRRTTVREQSRTLVYERVRDTSTHAPLIRSAENTSSRSAASEGAPFIVANSMREVQPEINLLVSPIPENLYWQAPTSAPRWTAQTTGGNA